MSPLLGSEQYSTRLGKYKDQLITVGGEVLHRSYNEQYQIGIVHCKIHYGLLDQIIISLQLELFSLLVGVDRFF